MDAWQGWRKRAKEWKKDNGLSDSSLAASMGVKRGTINSWFNKREPNLSDFIGLCEAMGADPGMILFEVPVLRGMVARSSDAQIALRGSPTADPHHQELVKKIKQSEKVREFKKKKSRVRAIIIR